MSKDNREYLLHVSPRKISYILIGQTPPRCCACYLTGLSAELDVGEVSVRIVKSA